MESSLLPLPQLEPSFHRDSLPTFAFNERGEKTKEDALLICTYYLVYQNYDSQRQHCASMPIQFDQSCFLISVISSIQIWEGNILPIADI